MMPNFERDDNDAPCKHGNRERCSDCAEEAKREQAQSLKENQAWFARWASLPCKHGHLPGRCLICDGRR